MIHNNQLSTLLAKISEHEGIRDFLIVLYGNFNQEVVTSSIELIENKCKELNYSTSMSTKIKIVSVEILQNINKHQHFSAELLPYFVIGATSEKVTIYSGNVVNRSSKVIINERLNIYNTFDAEQLRNFYRDSLKNTSISNAGNAGIGLLDIVYRSNQQVEYNFHDFKDDLYYFGLNVNIANSKK